MSHVWMSHVTGMSLVCHMYAYEYDASCECVWSCHVKVMAHISMSPVTQLSESCYVCVSPVSNINESSSTFE